MYGLQIRDLFEGVAKLNTAKTALRVSLQHACMSLGMYVCMCMRDLLYVYVCMLVYVCMCMLLCVCIYIYIYIHIHVHIRIHIDVPKAHECQAFRVSS